VSESIGQGEIREYGSAKVVVLSNADTNEDGFPIVVLIERGRDDWPPYKIRLGEQDPVAGVADVARVGAVAPARLGPMVGLMSGATLQRLRDAVGELISPDDAEQIDG
jgi:mRNA-degrading endonuclease toxin of MazEF toxin-antitoxin module